MSVWLNRSKALFMLVVFAANFYTICHCAPLVSHATLPQHACCMHKQPSPDNNVPRNKDGCTHNHSIKFNLLEKQTARPIALHTVSMAPHSSDAVIPVITLTTHFPGRTSFDDRRLRRYVPPDRLALYQLFLI